MSLKINTFHASVTTVKPKTPPTREFTISPALYGRTKWNLDTLSRMNISSSGQWTITPNMDFTASIKMWGAGGGSAGAGGYVLTTGGGGGFSSGVMTFINGTPYILVVGEAGTAVTGINGPYTIGGGGYGQGGNSTARNFRGGGLSGIFANTYSHDSSIIIAGGGGAKNAGPVSGDYGGAGGGASGQNGNGGLYGDSFGGTQTAGGSPATVRAPYGYSGSKLLGGLGCIYTSQVGAGSSGGGGGYFGGGGGSYTVEGAGGGGSGFIGGVINGTTITGNGGFAGNASDPDRGISGNGGNASGNYPPMDGRVIIS